MRPTHSIWQRDTRSMVVFRDCDVIVVVVVVVIFDVKLQRDSRRVYKYERRDKDCAQERRILIILALTIFLLFFLVTNFLLFFFVPFSSHNLPFYFSLYFCFVFIFLFFLSFDLQLFLLTIFLPHSIIFPSFSFNPKINCIEWRVNR